MKTAYKVGLITIVAAVMLAAMITWKSNILLIRGGIEFYGSFTNIEGLTIGSEVRYRGFTIGKVMHIDPGPQDIRLTATIKKNINIPNDSYLRVGFDGIVGLKYLEIRPGSSEVYVKDGDTLVGISTAGIVDFVDIGAKNLVETKAILETIRKVIEDPKLQSAITNAVLATENITDNVGKLTSELRATNKGIMDITTDSNFQQNVKGTIKQTNETLASANMFFESFSKINLKPSADISYGSAANQVRGNLDVIQNEKNFLRFGIGEGPTRDLSLQDIYLSGKATDVLGLKLGMLNSRLGGGIDLYLNPSFKLAGDIYDINNPKPNVPKFRVSSYFGLVNYLDLMLQADDLLNSARNFSFGISVKSQ
ncbi:MAG: hypothetical protein FD145_835 [Candidatus Saganbacteria bacterium]|uniref:Mce/MlaD domain-containing protein n=1 Tax=Candidatus Saganbacteria bacterium TaxID=2575572 RepID=A0A833L130_UNCSA|nr:MAG: hypothetical protein FD145_835 [Candidatus Saganbacteria bacterium]